METHAHELHKAPGKNFWHYIFEFFMLFLAVSAGFFVENFRDHLLDRKHEKEYMQSLLNDLNTDITNIDSVIFHDTETKQQCDSLFMLLSLNDYSDNTGSIYFNARRISLRYFFYITDGTLKQLNNAGGLRLIRFQDVVDSINGYENRNAELQKVQDLKESQLSGYREACENVFDVKVFESIVHGTRLQRPTGNPKLFSQDPKDINQLLIRAHYLKRNNSGIIESLQELRRRAANLQALIKKDYDLK
jgi:hypothetical protein